MKYEFEKGPFDISFGFIIELNILPQISLALLILFHLLLKLIFLSFLFFFLYLDLCIYLVFFRKLFRDCLEKGHLWICYFLDIGFYNRFCFLLCIYLELMIRLLEYVLDDLYMGFLFLDYCNNNSFIFYLINFLFV